MVSFCIFWSLIFTYFNKRTIKKSKSSLGRERLPRRVLFSLPFQCCASALVNYLHCLQWVMFSLHPLGLCICSSFFLGYSSLTTLLAWLTLPFPFAGLKFHITWKVFSDLIYLPTVWVKCAAIACILSLLYDSSYFIFIVQLLLLNCKLRLI